MLTIPTIFRRRLSRTLAFMGLKHHKVSKADGFEEEQKKLLHERIQKMVEDLVEMAKKITMMILEKLGLVPKGSAPS